MVMYVLIRDYKPGDEKACQDVVREATMSTVNAAFLSGLTREITFQVIILTSAIMFIFVGVPFSICLGSIPLVIVFMYLSIWSSHVLKAIQLHDDVNSIPRTHMSSKFTGFWVAEVYERLLDTNPQLSAITIVSDKEVKELDLSKYRRKIVGTIALTKSNYDENTAWLRNMAVQKKYQRKGIGTALLAEVFNFCHDKGYQYVELVTSECHDAARELFLKKGFELKQLYHKQIIGSLVTVQMFQLSYKLNVSVSP